MMYNKGTMFGETTLGDNISPKDIKNIITTVDNQSLSTTSSPTFDDLTLTGTLTPSSTVNLKTWNYFDDFMTSVSVSGDGAGFWLQNTSGAGAALNNNGTILRPGIAELNTGTTSSGYNQKYFGGSPIIFGGGIYIFETDIKLSALSDGTNTYKVHCGWSLPLMDTLQGTYFYYSDSGSTPNWYMCVYQMFSGVRIDTTIPVTTDWTRLKIYVDTNHTHFYINNVECTNSPITSIFCTTAMTGPFISITKTVGATNRTLYTDWANLYFDLTTSR